VTIPYVPLYGDDSDDDDRGDNGGDNNHEIDERK